MKRFIGFLGLLCLYFTTEAQENTVNKGIQPGQRMPAVFVSNVKGLKIGGREVPGFWFSALRGKPVIIDFWATWCAPCRAMVPVMDSLQKVFGERVLFLPVSYEKAAVVAPVVAAMRREHPFDLPEVTGDIALERLFPHRSLPHYVWIDSSGVVRAITEYGAVNAANIRALIDGTRLSAEQKRDVSVSFDANRPMLLGGNGGDGSTVRYHSLLSDYIPGLHGGLHISAVDSVRGQRITARNVPLTWLCRLAYGEHGRWFSNARIMITSRDSLKMMSDLSGQAYGRWLAAGSGYCYELLLPPALVENAYPIMQADLRRMFPQYAVSVQRQKMPCLALVRTSDNDKLKTSGGTPAAEIDPFSCRLRNTDLGKLVLSLERQYMQHSPLPIVNATGYTRPVDMVLEAPMTDVQALNAALSKYDLRLVRQDAEVELLKISDAGSIHALPKL